MWIRCGAKGGGLCPVPWPHGLPIQPLQYQHESEFTMPAMTLPCAEFVGLLTDLARSTTDELEQLDGVLLHTVRGEGKTRFLVGESTDRYMAAQAHVADVEGFMPTLFLPSASVKLLLAALKAQGKGATKAEVTLSTYTNTMRATTEFGVSITVGFNPDVQFPDLTGLLATPEATGGQVCLSPVYVGMVQTVAKRRRVELHLTLPENPRKPAVAIAGERYRAVIVPIRSEVPVVPVFSAKAPSTHATAERPARSGGVTVVPGRVVASTTAATVRALPAGTKARRTRKGGRRKAA